MELPFVGLSVVDNQTATGRKVESHWGMPVLFLEGESSNSLDLKASLTQLWARQRNAYSEVDTAGACRVADALEGVWKRRSGRG
jgi:hypothetical protein